MSGIDWEDEMFGAANVEAAAEGWELIDYRGDDGVGLIIEPVVGDKVFTKPDLGQHYDHWLSRQRAREHVEARAAEGSALHTHALALLLLHGQGRRSG